MLALLVTAGLLLITLVFAAQNPDAVPVRFLTRDLQVSKLILMFGFLFVGAFVTSFVNSLTEISARRIFREFAIKITELEKLLAERTAKVTELEAQLNERSRRLVDVESELQCLSAREPERNPSSTQGTEDPPTGGLPT